MFASYSWDLLASASSSGKIVARCASQIADKAWSALCLACAAASRLRSVARSTRIGADEVGGGGAARISCTAAAASSALRETGAGVDAERRCVPGGGDGGTGIRCPPTGSRARPAARAAASMDRACSATTQVVIR